MQSENVAVTFGFRIKQLRNARGWRQEDLARRLGEALGKKVDTTTVTRLETGKRPVPLEEAVALATIFETDLNRLTMPAISPLAARLDREQALVRQLRQDALDHMAAARLAEFQSTDAEKRAEATGALLRWEQWGDPASLDAAVHWLRMLPGDELTSILRDGGFMADTITAASRHAMNQAGQIEPGQDPDTEYNKHFARYLLEHRPRQADESAGHATDPGS